MAESTLTKERRWLSKGFATFTKLVFHHPDPGPSDVIATVVITLVLAVPVMMFSDPYDFGAPPVENQQAQIQSQDEAYAQMRRNFAGDARDSFRCATSTQNQPIVSFDNGTYWWKDDGRCAGRLQKRRDENAQIYSYWSTTIRVDTDMNSSWLPDEERTCQTLPSDSGRVATVVCDATSHANHNIPVTFWGGVDRDTVSDWKCRREKDFLSDRFVCRAID